MRSESLLQQRICGAGHRVLPVQISALRASPAIVDDQHPFCCIVTTKETSGAVSEYLSRSTRPVLHISEVDEGGSAQLGSVTLDTFRNYFVEAIESVNNPDGQLLKVKDDLLTRGLRSSAATPLSLTQYSHGITWQNELILENLGYRFRSFQKLTPQDEAGYVQALL
jgi:hypothetical protein